MDPGIPRVLQRKTYVDLVNFEKVRHNYMECLTVLHRGALHSAVLVLEVIRRPQGYQALYNTYGSGFYSPTRKHFYCEGRSAFL